ncbi:MULTISPECIES: hypothetical protein [unclassified Streptomyces]|uniref:hypothetical protein n=1 Tax=unclassified Streptomyces TaxID=2593676 RepID=UPI002E2B588B|nr:hypothetical protein [Streptomyces sp. NBC_00273]
MRRWPRCASPGCWSGSSPASAEGRWRASDDGMSAETVATALGTAYSKALVMLLTAQDR